MTDKEKIIIDSTDVSECKYLHTSVFNENSYLCDCAVNVFQNCFNTPNCYYKQLQRKITECEEMEIAIKIKDQRNEDYSKALANKSKECEELKKELEHADNASGFILHDYQRLEKVLNKIKSYCEYIQAFNEANKCNKTDTKTILDIINEAKDDEQCQKEK